MIAWTKVGADHWRARVLGGAHFEVWLASGVSPWVLDVYMAAEHTGPPTESGDFDTLEEAKTAALEWAAKLAVGLQTTTEARI